jgi:hypothetical protein
MWGEIMPRLSLTGTLSRCSKLRENTTSLSSLGGQTEEVTTNLAATNPNCAMRQQQTPRLLHLAVGCLPLIIKHTLYQTNGVHGSANNPSNNVIMEIDPGHVPSTQRHGAGEPRWERTGADIKSGSCKVSTKVSMLPFVMAKRSISHRVVKWESRTGTLSLGGTISVCRHAEIKLLPTHKGFVCYF